jgi:hypothetical protein
MRTGPTVEPMDLVAALHEGKLTSDEAEDRLGDLIGTWLGTPEDLDGFLAHVGMSKREYTAYLHGASLTVIAMLRYAGWPERCSGCDRPIDYELGFWFHPADGARIGRVGCITCGGHAAQDVVPWAKA